jgi:hypothetical protein
VAVVAVAAAAAVAVVVAALLLDPGPSEVSLVVLVFHNHLAAHLWVLEALLANLIHFFRKMDKIYRSLEYFYRKKDILYFRVPLNLTLFNLSLFINLNIQ